MKLSYRVIFILLVASFLTAITVYAQTTPSINNIDSVISNTSCSDCKDGIKAFKSSFYCKFDGQFLMVLRDKRQYILELQKRSGLELNAADITTDVQVKYKGDHFFITLNDKYLRKLRFSEFDQDDSLFITGYIISDVKDGEIRWTIIANEIQKVHKYYRIGK